MKPLGEDAPMETNLGVAEGFLDPQNIQIPQGAPKPMSDCP